MVVAVIVSCIIARHVGKLLETGPCRPIQRRRACAPPAQVSNSAMRIPCYPRRCASAARTSLPPGGHSSRRRAPRISAISPVDFSNAAARPLHCQLASEDRGFSDRRLGPAARNASQSAVTRTLVDRLDEIGGGRKDRGRLRHLVDSQHDRVVARCTSTGWFDRCRTAPYRELSTSSTAQ